MARQDLGNTSNSDYSRITETTVDSKSLDSPGSNETIYNNENFEKYYGYYMNNADLRAAIQLKAIWNVGKGYTANPEDQVYLDIIKGTGKESFTDILYNLEITRKVNGDAYAEIIKVKDKVVNLKPLNPSRVSVVYDRKGMITEYRVRNGDGKEEKFQPEEIFHISNNKVGDQIHGTSDIESQERTLIADNESFEDIKRLMHTQVKPLIIWKLKTDNATKIAAFKAKIEEARKYGDDTFIPDDDDTVTHEIVQVNPSNTVFQWRDEIRNRFYRNIQLPQIVPGGSGGSTESESKTIYLAFEQIVEHEQRYLEAQIKNQLGYDLDLIPPVSMAPNLQTDTMKDGGLYGGLNG